MTRSTIRHPRRKSVTESCGASGMPTKNTLTAAPTTSKETIAVFPRGLVTPHPHHTQTDRLLAHTKKTIEPPSTTTVTHAAPLHPKAETAEAYRTEAHANGVMLPTSTT